MDVLLSLLENSHIILSFSLFSTVTVLWYSIVSHHMGRTNFIGAKIVIYISFSSFLQLVRSNSRRFMPSQADDEAHQLSYLQKHLANIISLLAEPVEGEGDESLVSSNLSYILRGCHCSKLQEYKILMLE